MDKLIWESWPTNPHIWRAKLGSTHLTIDLANGTYFGTFSVGSYATQVSGRTFAEVEARLIQIVEDMS